LRESVYEKVLFVVLLVASVFPGVPSAAALAAGLVFALVTGGVFPAFSRQAMCATLFLIGSTLSLSSLRRVGVRPLLQGVALWILTAAASLMVVMW
jgi:uncharacterized membrane protein YadS